MKAESLSREPYVFDGPDPSPARPDVVGRINFGPEKSECRCTPPLADPDCPRHGYQKPIRPAVVTPIVEKLTDSHRDLKLACFDLLAAFDNGMPYSFALVRIGKLIDFKWNKPL